MQGRRNNIHVYAGMVYYECFDWFLYQVVFFFIFCKDDSEMLRLSKKLSNFSMMFYTETSQLQTLHPHPHTNI